MNQTSTLALNVVETPEGETARLIFMNHQKKRPKQIDTETLILEMLRVESTYIPPGLAMPSGTHLLLLER